MLCHWVAKNPPKHTPCRRSCPRRALISQSWKFRLCTSWSKESRNILWNIMKYWWIFTHGGHLERLIFSKIAIPPLLTPWHPVLLTEVAWRGSLAVVPNSGKWRKSSWNQAGEYTGTYGIQGNTGHDFHGKHLLGCPNTGHSLDSFCCVCVLQNFGSWKYILENGGRCSPSTVYWSLPRPPSRYTNNSQGEHAERACSCPMRSI